MEEIKKEFEDLITIKTFLKGAINEKGGTITDDTPFSEYPNQVRTKTGNVFDTLTISENGRFDTKDYKSVSVFVSNTDFEKIKNAVENKNLEIPYGITKIESGVLTPFEGTIILPNSLKEIGGGCSANFIQFNGTLEEWLSIPKGKDTSTTSDIFINSSVNYALGFYDKIYANALHEDIVIPNNLVEIPRGMLNGFMFSQGKHSITIPSSVTKVGRRAMFRIKNVKDIIFEKGQNVEFIGELHFAYATNLDIVSNLVLPITKILPEGFAQSSEFTNIILQDGLEEIGRSCFNGCKKITKIDFPSSLLKIGDLAFGNCTSLTEIILPKNITQLGSNIFANVSTIKNITIESETPFTIASNSLPKISGIRYYVPKGTSATYKSATNWSSYASYIYEKYVVAFNVPSALLNNETITYSVDGGKTYQQFTSGTMALNEVATIKIKSTDSSQVVKVGTTAGGNDVGTISNSELTFSFTTDTSVYLTIQ